MVGVASQLSTDVGLPVLAGNVLVLHCIVTLAGQLIVGAILSTTEIVCTHVMKLPQ